jgi:hypothetical protein
LGCRALLISVFIEKENGRTARKEMETKIKTAAEEWQSKKHEEAEL